MGYESEVCYGVVPIDTIKIDEKLLNDEDLQLESILEEEGILNSNQLEYRFTKKEIWKLIL